MSLYPITAFVTASLALGLGLVVYLKGPNIAANKRWGIMSLSIAFWSAFLGVLFVSDSYRVGFVASRCLQLGATFIPITFFHFTLALLGIERSKRYWLIFGYAVTVVMLILGFTPLFIRDVVYSPLVDSYYPVAGKTYVLYIATFFLYSGAAWYLMARSLSQITGLERNQIKYVMIASSIGFLSGASTFLLWYGIEVPPLGVHTVFLYTTIISVAIIRYRLMDINLAIARTAVFIVVYALIMGMPVLFASAWKASLEGFFGDNWWMIFLVAYGFLATAAHYANSFFQSRAEARLQAEQRRYQAVLRQASQGMTLIKELGKLLSLIVHLLTRVVRIRHAAIYLWDRKSEQFTAKVSRFWPVKTPPTYTLHAPLIEYFNKQREPLVAEEVQLQVRSGDRTLAAVAEGLKAINAAVLVPSFVENRCMGFLILGEKKSGGFYSQDDIQVFQVLASQAALAIENAQFYQELQQTQADLFQTGKMASLGHMAGGMSHQINNRFHVLAILAGTMKSVIKDEDPDTMDPKKRKMIWEKLYETLVKVESNAMRGGDIVKTLLRFSRPAKDYEPITVSTILDTAVEVVQFRVDLNTLNFVRDIPEDLPEVFGDLNQLADSCFNLISNANDAIQKKAELIGENQIKPSSKDPDPYKGTVTVKARVKESEGKSWITLEIADNGVGMTAEDLQMLFVPFFTTKATANKGTGLGLYVIQRISERHGGGIAATSVYGEGTTFTIRLPAFIETPVEK